MKKWIVEHPYVVTTVVFLIVIGFGWSYLYWEERDFAFVLLLYFIVTLGIRLDEISRKINNASHQSLRSSKERQAIIAQLKQIQVSLLTLNKTLAEISQNSSRRTDGDP